MSDRLENALQLILSDLSSAVRTLRMRPRLTAATILALAVGIGANTALFAMLNAVLFRPLPGPDANRLVRLAQTHQGVPLWIVGLRQFVDWRKQADSIEDVSAHWLDLANLTNAASPEQIPLARVTRDFFHLFGATLVKGRVFTPDEDRPGGPAVVMLSYDVWQRQFRADPAIVGRIISVGGDARRVVGVLARDFDSQQFDQLPGAWVPFQIDPNAPAPGVLCFVTGTLAPGVTASGAQAQLDLLAQRRLAVPVSNAHGSSVMVVPLREAMVSDVRTPLLVLVSAMGLVVLLACVSVSGLLLVTAMGRYRDVAVRAALGSSRGRFALDQLMEGLVLAAPGGSLGWLFAKLSIHGFLAAYPGRDPLSIGNQTVSLPRITSSASSVPFDWRVLLFMAAMAALTVVMCALVPAVRAWRTDAGAVLVRNDGPHPGARRLRAVVVVIEIALAVILLVGAGLLIRTSHALLAVDTGFDGRHVITMRMSIAATPLATQRGLGQLTREGIDRLQVIPGVAAAGSACCVPLETVWQAPLIIPGRPLVGRSHAVAGWTFVSPGYFDALAIPLLRGRAFAASDNAGAAGVIIINDALEQQLWPRGDALDHSLLVGRSLRPEFDSDPERRIIGVVGNVRDQGLDRAARPAVYVPVAQIPDGVAAYFAKQLPLTWIIRARADPLAVAAEATRQLEAASHGLPVTRLRTMNAIAMASIDRARFGAIVMTTFALVALVLAFLGIYVLLGSSVTERTREIGIRMAVGADARRLRLMILAQGLRLAAVGTSLGLGLAYVLSDLLAGLLFGVTPHDPGVFTAVPLIICVSVVAASWMPARQAARVRPVIALKDE